MFFETSSTLLEKKLGSMEKADFEKVTDVLRKKLEF